MLSVYMCVFLYLLVRSDRLTSRVCKRSREAGRPVTETRRSVRRHDEGKVPDVAKLPDVAKVPDVAAGKAADATFNKATDATSKLINKTDSDPDVGANATLLTNNTLINTNLDVSVAEFDSSVTRNMSCGNGNKNHKNATSSKLDQISTLNNNNNTIKNSILQIDDHVFNEIDEKTYSSAKSNHSHVTGKVSGNTSSSIINKFSTTDRTASDVSNNKHSTNLHVSKKLLTNPNHSESSAKSSSNAHTCKNISTAPKSKVGQATEGEGGPGEDKTPRNRRKTRSAAVGE